MSLTARLLVVSDSASVGRRTDRSGPAVRELLQSRGWTVSAVEILPDDAAAISERLRSWVDVGACDVVFTSGGTGLGPRDVTPEATRAVIEREIPGLAELMRAEGLKKVRRAMLSRAVVGMRKGRLIVNLPGSVRGACEAAEAILDLLPHAVDIAQGRTEH